MTTKRAPKFILLTVLSGVALALACITPLPYSGSHPNLIGYRSICAFVPLSTLTLVGLAAFLRFYRDSVYPPAKRAPDGTRGRNPG